MLGLLRTAVAAAAQRPVAAVQLPRSIVQAKANSLPFIPTDWIFRFFPYISRDRVRFLLRFNQISFLMGLGYFYLWAHAPYKCDHYEGFYESPLYRYTRGELEKTGQLEENLRIKVKHFYPQTEE
mmetsp:Transcript_114930/g.297885  ORF Transcript_114930/g.297885 Transcript_114930/m.297885 type:complete len:125 (-) Transcript_114930:95-469(-)